MSDIGAALCFHCGVFRTLQAHRLGSLLYLSIVVESYWGVGGVVCG